MELSWLRIHIESQIKKYENRVKFQTDMAQSYTMGAIYAYNEILKTIKKNGG